MTADPRAASSQVWPAWRRAMRTAVTLDALVDEACRVLVEVGGQAGARVALSTPPTTAARGDVSALAVALPLAVGDALGLLEVAAADGEARALLDELAADLAAELTCRTERDELARAVTVRSDADRRAHEQELREITEALPQIVWAGAPGRARFHYVSPAFARLFGAPVDELLGDAELWLDLVVDDDRQAVADAIAGLPDTGSYDLDYRTCGRDGVVRWMHEHAVALRDGTGAVVRIAGVTEDITGRRLLEQQLRQAQKLEAVGQLAGGVAHDFNNLLAIVQMQASVLLEEATTADQRDSAAEILTASERAADLTRQLLTFSRRRHPHPEVLDLAATTGGILKLLRRVLGEDIVVHTQLGDGRALVHADPGMMEQVLMNLAVNARDAMPDGGRLDIRVVTVDVDGARARRHGAAAGRYVELTVADTGAGISAAHLPHIFEPFFTTKQLDRGTGLGLSTVLGIVELHHGWIEVDSTPGAGTTFRVLLPESAPAPATAGDATAGHGGHETILVVEDEAPVRASTRTVLERAGYRVLEAESAAYALGLWDEHGSSIDLLLTDLIMPGAMTGRQLAEALRARAPSLKVVYTSGYSPDILDRILPTDDAIRGLLPKPYSALALVARVRQTLDGGQDPRS